MMNTWTRDKILALLLEKNGGFKAGVCKEDDSWYVKKNLISIRDFIVQSTDFLNSLFPPFKMRMLYFKLGLNQIQVCPICKKGILEPVYNENRFRKTCKSTSCRKDQKSFNAKEMHKNFSQEERDSKNKKIGIKNSGSYEEKFGKEKSDILKAKIGKRATCRIQTDGEKRKRIETRRKNNEFWHSEETKSKISKTNRDTHLSEDFKNKHLETYKNSRIKLSEIMKRMILSGDFTPTASNWKKSPRAKLKIEKHDFSFRSKWEATYYVVRYYEGFQIEYETIRIPYRHDGNENIFIVDFLDKRNNLLIEVRPKSRQKSSKKEIEKFEAAKTWAQENGLQFIVIDEDWFQENWELIERSLERFGKETNQQISLRKPFKCHS